MKLSLFFNKSKKHSLAFQIPWTTRDVWLGIGFLGIWIFLFIGFSAVIQFLFHNLDWGLMISAAETALLIPVWLLSVHKYRIGWKHLGLRSFDPEILLLAAALMAASLGFNFIYGLILHFFGLRIQPDLGPILIGLKSPWIFFVAGAVIAPIVEEIFFRGFLFAGFKKRYGWKIAAVLSSAFFAVIHFQPTAVIPIFILGIIFCFLYEQSESIWPGILMHIASNSLALGTAYAAAKSGLLN